MSSIPLVQIISISTALVASGGIATLSLFDIPEMRSQPASRSLPSIRWLFSRGSHIFPEAAFVSGAGFAYLAYTALPSKGRLVTQLLSVGANGQKVNAFLVAAALSMSIGPFTSLMIPANFALIRLNEEKGGSRSAESARSGMQNKGSAKGMTLSADDSVNGVGQPNQFLDLSDPQMRTADESTAEEDEKVRELLTKFGRLNMGRALLLGAGGVVGLWASLL